MILSWNGSPEAQKWHPEPIYRAEYLSKSIPLSIISAAGGE